MMPQTARMPTTSNPFKQVVPEEEKKEEIIPEPVKKEEITKIEEPRVKEDEVNDFTAEVILNYMNKPAKRADLLDDNKEDEDETPMKCYKCKGSKMNKKGTKPCKKCSGSGTF